MKTLLADLVVDASDELADHLGAVARSSGSAEDRLDAVLHGTCAWAALHPNAYRLIFQTSIAAWAHRSDLTHLPVAVLRLALLTWTRLHGIISPELGGHLAATGTGADVLFDAEVQTIRSEAAHLAEA